MSFFYDRLNQFRRQKHPSGSYYETLYHYYFKLLKPHSTLSATAPETHQLSDADLNKVASLLQSPPNDLEEFYHHLWLMNSLAFYRCFIEGDYQTARNLTLELDSLGERVYRGDFSKDAYEKRSLLFIFSLNLIRLSFYLKEYEPAIKMAQTYRKLLEGKEAKAGTEFPEPMRSHLNQYGAEIAAKLPREMISYYEEKLKAIEDRLERLNYKSLLDAVKSHAINQQNKTAFFDHDQNQRYTWADTKELSNLIAQKIETEAAGAKYVLVSVKQNILHPASLIASWQTGKIPIPISPDITANELSEYAVNFEDSFVVLTEHPNLQERLKLTSGRPFNIVRLKEEALSASQTPVAISHHKNSLQNNFALGLFTSGTTHTPKLCIFTHKSLLQAAEIELRNEPIYQKGTIANLRPHFTSAGLNSLWPCLLTGQSTTVFSEKIRKTPIARFLSGFLKDKRPDLLILAPTYLIALDQNGLDGLSYDSPSHNPLPLYFGGSSLPESLLIKLIERGFLPVMRYGMTEVLHIISKKPYRLPLSNYDKADVGYPLPGFETKVIDGYLTITSPGLPTSLAEDGKVTHLDENQNGQITLRSLDQVTLKPGEPISLMGRDNQTININGFRFQAVQVERVLQTASAVIDVRVFEREQTLVAYVIGDASLEKVLRTAAEKNLSPHKRPSRYVFLKAWPAGANGKIDFNKLN